jgi:hypothetical protein
MAWIKRMLMFVGGLTLLIAALLVVIAMLDSGQQSGVRQSISFGDRTISLSGDYQNSSSETFGGGSKITLDGEEVLVSRDGIVTIDGKPQSFGDFKELRLDVEDGVITPSVVTP